MKPTAFILAQIVTFIVDNQLDNCPFGQVCWFIQYQSTFLDARSKTAHIIQSTARGLNSTSLRDALGSEPTEE